jgi:hypothetical protein
MKKTCADYLYQVGNIRNIWAKSKHQDTIHGFHNIQKYQDFILMKIKNHVL